MEHFPKKETPNPVPEKGANSGKGRVWQGGPVDSRDWSDWRWQYAHRIRRPADLAAYLGASPKEGRVWGEVARIYPLAVTPYYLSLLDRSDPGDPLRRQCVPDGREIAPSCHNEEDPLGEEASMPVPGLIHRYPDRCLILASRSCAVLCRHCNRKRLWSRPAPRLPRSVRFGPMFRYIAQTPSIREVILSGGDPLTLTDGTLDWLLGSLRAIPHVEVLRIGSRMPVVLPMRITPDLCEILKRHRPLWFNTQFNAPGELTPEAAHACDRILLAGIPLSSQAVLLRGVNDDETALETLCNGLQRMGVRPYYLFQCDPVRGTDFFRVEEERGAAIMGSLWSRMSGLCLPRYVRDDPQRGGKIPIPFARP